MKMMKRYAIYYAPAEGPFAGAAACWLGRDAATDRDVAQPAIAGCDLASLTDAPRRYGFHGTLKPPFRLTGTDPAGLEAALTDVAAKQAPVMAGPLAVARIGHFLALVPAEPLAGIKALAARVVEVFEPCRAPLSEAEYARRRPESLTARQRALLDLYGYPYVMEEFRFHLTLTGPMDAGIPAVEAAARDWFAPYLTAPFRIADLCLFGEDEAGLFHLLSRHALTG
ncbi:MAG: DUF1045 domain-containing protein [Albidovulum sp.]|uniref:DUF1045 domain-containing protein n=1 Tax=Albidovulum sp. TaxID=1872424 RepID=UPI003CB296E2